MLVGGILAGTSALALAWLASGRMIPSVVRDPLEVFVSPGVKLWWFVLGGPFRTGPTTAGGILFAAVANGGLGLGAVALGMALVRTLGKRKGRPRP